MLFANMASILSRMEKTRKKTEISKLFQELFSPEGTVERKEMIHDKIVCFMQGKLHPNFLGKPELQMGQAMAKSALCAATGMSASKVDDLLRKTGDLGDIMLESERHSLQVSLLDFKNTKKDPLVISDVYDVMEMISVESGVDSQKKKVRMLADLLRMCSAIEAKYVLRFVTGKMRLGINDAGMIDATARRLMDGNGDEKRDAVERAYNVHPDLGLVLKTAMTGGIDAVRKFIPTIGTPMRPMLAQRLEHLSEYEEKLGFPFACEYKLDGERAQIHVSDHVVKIFSRQQEDITSQFPDVASWFSGDDAWNSFHDAIIDGEIVPMSKDGKFLPFQVLMQRKRKHDISSTMAGVPVKFYAFDFIYIDGNSLLDMTYKERRKKLEIYIGNAMARVKNIVIVPKKIVSNMDEVVDFYNEAIKAGTEGLVTKSLNDDSVYMPGGRTFLWIKLKSLKKGKLPDSMDLVVVGGNWGEGRRAKQLASLFVAGMDKETGELVTITKVASGMDDEKDGWFVKNLVIVNDKPSNVRIGKEKPDAWIDPVVVIEVIGDEVSDSDSSAAGISIRFPRMLRVRPDKKVAETTTIDEIRAMQPKECSG